MTTFNKILNPMYSAIAAYSKQEDGSINTKYVLGTGEDSDGSVTNFTLSSLITNGLMQQQLKS